MRQVFKRGGAKSPREDRLGLDGGGRREAKSNIIKSLQVGWKGSSPLFFISKEQEVKSMLLCGGFQLNADQL